MVEQVEAGGSSSARIVYSGGTAGERRTVSKKTKSEIAERQARASDKRQQEIARRRARGGDADSMSAAEAARLIDTLDTAEAADSGLTLAEWRALTESQRVKLWEDSQDSNREMTLTEFRREMRRRIEAGEMRDPYTGFPQWLRDQYAAERPVEVAIEYLSLLRALETTTGDALKEVIRKIAERTWRGWAIERTVEHARTLLLEEIDRVGLREIFNEARDQSELQRILNS
jgi:hypothetical protein